MPRVWKTPLADMERGLWRSLEGRIKDDHWTDGGHHPGPPSEVVRMTIQLIKGMREHFDRQETGSEVDGDQPIERS